MVDHSDTLYSPSREFLKFSVVGAMHKAPLMPYKTLLKILKEDLDLSGGGTTGECDYAKVAGEAQALARKHQVTMQGDMDCLFEIDGKGGTQIVKTFPSSQ